MRLCRWSVNPSIRPSIHRFVIIPFINRVLLPLPTCLQLVLTVYPALLRRSLLRDHWTNIDSLSLPISSKCKTTTEKENNKRKKNFYPSSNFFIEIDLTGATKFFPFRCLKKDYRANIHVFFANSNLKQWKKREVNLW